MMNKKLVYVSLLSLAIMNAVDSANFLRRFAGALKTIGKKSPKKVIALAAVAGGEGGSTHRSSNFCPPSENMAPTVDETLHLNEEKENWGEQYVCPEDQNKQFSKFEMSSSDEGLYKHVSVVLTQEASHFRAPSQALLNKLPLLRVSQPTDPVAHIQVTDNTISIQPRKDLIGFVTAEQPRVGIGGRSRSIVNDALRQNNRIPNDPKANPLLESAIVRQYRFDFYPHGLCIKTGRPIYGKRAGSITLTISSKRNHASQEIALDHRVAITNPQGMQTIQKTHIAYPTYAKCSINVSKAFEVTRGINESEEDWQARSSSARKCLRTPIVFAVDTQEK